MFVDEAQINVRGGDGGAGCVAFLREYRRPNGGPDGGDGGRGGDTILVADPSVATLLRFKNEIHFRAESGKHGEGRKRHGRRGTDLEIRVPAGTLVSTLGGETLADLVNPGDAFVAAEGGRGGRGNARFVTRSRRAPTFAEQSEPGEETWLKLELRLLADVGLVGFPNAGKSTFVSTVSAARPKIADYPFTTLEPSLGVARIGDDELVVADIPGLIEGAAAGKGLGHQFLRHVQRSRVLVFLLDPLNVEASPAQQLDILRRELADFDSDLARRPAFVAVTKADAFATPESLRAEFDGLHWSGSSSEPEGVRTISSVSGYGIDELLRDLARVVVAERAAAPAAKGHVLHRPAPAAVEVRRDGDGWVVEGVEALRAVAVNDLTNAEALAFVQDRLRGLGVDAALAEAGCRGGDEVKIGGFDFEYEPDE